MNKNDGTHNKEIMAKGRLKSKPKKWEKNKKSEHVNIYIYKPSKTYFGQVLKLVKVLGFPVFGLSCRSWKKLHIICFFGF